MFKRKVTRKIFRILMLVPIVPIIFVISYLNQYSGIDGSLRLYISIILICLALALAFLGLFFIKKKRQVGTIIMAIVAVILSLGSGYFTYVNARVYGSLNQMVADQSTSYYNLVTMTDSQINDISGLSGKRVAVFNLKDQEAAKSLESYVEESGLSVNNEISMFDSPIEMVHALYNDEIDAMIIGSNYKSLFLEKEGFENIETETQVLDVIQVVTEQTSNSKSTSLTEEPFSILLIGIDSTDGIEDTGLADSLILATFNPQTLSITMTSIPRDSYVEIPYFNYAKDKITHSHNGGTTAVVEAVENLFDMEIPYYVKVNFSAVVELVDTLGGIEVDVPMAIEEQNSKRQFGKHLITIEEGIQTLDGEQALALSRHRKTLANGDLGRANNQQLVIEGIISKTLTELDTVNEFLALLNVLGNNIETNLSINDMTAFAQYLLELVPTFKSGNPLEYIHMMSMVLSGENTSVMTSYYSFPLSVVIPYQGAIADARELMFVNLEQQVPEFNFEFTFNGFGKNTKTWIASIYDEVTPNFETPVETPIYSTPQETTPSYEGGAPEVEVSEPEIYEPEIYEPEIDDSGYETPEDDNQEYEVPNDDYVEPENSDYDVSDPVVDTYAETDQEQNN